MQVTNPEIYNPKTLLRQEMQRLLRETRQESQAVLAALEHWLAGHPGHLTIAVFSALPGEVNLADLVAKHSGLSWVFPRVDGEELVFHRVKNPETDLLLGAFGIWEPSPTLPVVTADEIDAFFCPGLAFDRQGGRLGRGKGFYDRALASARSSALKIGICFPCQIVPDTFCQAHDIRMDEVVCGN
jgi:5-formyltetrahydrofolate cyclo-ligase